MLRLLLLTPLILATFLSPNSYPADTNGDDKIVIRALLGEWTANFNAERTDKVCEIFAPDLIANYGDFPEKNHESLCSHLKLSLKDPEKTFHYSLDIQEIIVSGDMAVVRLIWTLTVYDTRGELIETIKDRGMDVFRRQEDGKWKISRYLAYPMGKIK